MYSILAVTIAIAAGLAFKVTSMTDASRYSRALETVNSVAPEDAIDFFPVTIPDNAKNVRLVFVEPDLTGACMLMLKCTLPPKDLKEVVDACSTRCKAIHRPWMATQSSFSQPAWHRVLDGVLPAANLPNDYVPCLVFHDRRIFATEETSGVLYNKMNGDIVWWYLRMNRRVN